MLYQGLLPWWAELAVVVCDVVMSSFTQFLSEVSDGISKLPSAVRKVQARNGKGRDAILPITS